MAVSDLLNLPGWQVIAVEEQQDRYIIQARSQMSSSVCPTPTCGSTTIAKHGKDRQLIHDLPCHAKQVSIVFDRQRYRCLACKKTWFAPLSEVDEKRFATSRLIRYIERQSLTRTFVMLASDVGLDERSIRNIFHDYVRTLEQTVHIPTPVIMGMDELYLLGKPRGMITNVETSGFVEMLPDRKKQTIIRFLTNLSEKASIKVCVIDMWRPYLEALNEASPHVTIIIDKFHVVKLLSDIVETVRKEIRGTLNDRQRRELMHDRFLLLKRPDALSDQEQLILESWLGSFPRLKAVYERKEEFYTVYDAQTKEEAIKRYFAWFDHVVQSGVFDAFVSFTLTIENWGEFVFNYFTFRYTGGFVEAANGIGRVVDRQGRGYSFDVLRARLLYGQSLRQRKKRRESTVVDKHEDEAMSSTREHQVELLLSGARNTTESD